MTARERLKYEAQAQSNHDSYAELITELLDTIDERDKKIEELEDTVGDLESSLEELED